MIYTFEHYSLDIDRQELRRDGELVPVEPQVAQAGRTKQASAAMAKLRELQPNISIAWIEQYVPYTDRAMPHFLDGMRKAGLE